MSWLNAAQPAPGGWAALVRDLQILIASLLQESEIEPRQRYLEKSMALLREKAAAMAGVSQQIDFQLRSGQAYENFGALDEALAAYQRAAELCTAHHFVPQKIETLRWIGNIQARQSRWPEAAQTYQEMLALCASSGEALGQVHAENGLGSLFFEQGEFEQAAAHWGNALELAEKANAANEIAILYNNLGALANAQGQWDKALTCYGESLPRFETTGNMSGMASTYHNLAMTYADGNNWPEASVYYEKSFRLAQQLGDLNLQTLVKLNRVELYLAIGDAALAEALCQQVLQTYKHLQDHLGEADACKFLGMIAAQKRAWTKAKAHFAKSIRLALEFHHPLGEAEARWEYGRMLKQKGAAQNAREQFEQALALFRKVNAGVEIAKVQKAMAEL